MSPDPDAPSIPMRPPFMACSMCRDNLELTSRDPFWRDVLNIDGSDEGHCNITSVPHEPSTGALVPGTYPGRKW